MLNFVENYDMENHIDIAPRNFTKEVVDFAFDQAEKRLDKQVETFNRVVGRNTAILRWLLIGLCSLLGVLVSEVSRPSTNQILLWMTLYGIGAMLVTAVVLVLTGLFNKKLTSSGAGPSTILSKGRQNDMTRDGREDKLYALKEFHLEWLERAINDNEDEHRKVVKAYRRAVIMVTSEVVIGIILLVILLLIHTKCGSTCL